MKHLSRKDIEAIGTRVVTAYKKLPELQGKQIYRIEPDLLIKNLLGLNIEYHHLSLNGSVLGATSPATDIGIRIFDDPEKEDFFFFDGKTVLVERDLKEDDSQKGRCNFTSVHEASHQIFKMLYPKEYGYKPNGQNLHFYMNSSECRKPIENWEEWQTNVLTSYVLLPEELVGQAMQLFGLGEKIRMLNKIYSPRVYERFSDMADLLGVSKKALSIRLKQLGWLEQDYLDNPYALTEVVYEEVK